MRVHVKGSEGPIPTHAFPDPIVGYDRDPIRRYLADFDSPFRADDYIQMGYTHYEVVCIGGCGGNGGKAKSYDPSWGGAGGGGGLQVVAGELADLPAEVLIVTGVGGAHGADGNDESTEIYSSEAGQNVPNPAYVAPTDGADGTASSFGDICMASGGKGGKASPLDQQLTQWVEPFASQRGPGGDGGEGGIGGRTAVGGGGAGGWTELNDTQGGPAPDEQIHHPAQDGTFIDGIGKGGGGGRGGTYIPGEFIPQTGAQDPGRAHEAGHGGRGAFSYGDPSRHGPRELRKYHESSGFGLEERFPVIPGGGGGGWADISDQYGHYGSQHPDAGRFGVVFIILTQIW